MTKTNILQVECDLCHKLIKGNPEKIGHLHFDGKCYQVALKRLRPFLNIITLPEADYREWLDDDSQ